MVECFYCQVGCLIFVVFFKMLGQWLYENLKVIIISLVFFEGDVGLKILIMLVDDYYYNIVFLSWLNGVEFIEGDDEVERFCLIRIIDICKNLIIVIMKSCGFCFIYKLVLFLVW